MKSYCDSRCPDKKIEGRNNSAKISKIENKFDKNYFDKCPCQS